jgi:hypothetical protein
VPPIAKTGLEAAVLLIVFLACQLAPNNFKELSISPFLIHAATMLPLSSTHNVGEEAPVLDKVVVLLQLPFNVLLEALIVPFSTQTAVAFPFLSETIPTEDAPAAETVNFEPQLPLTSFVLDFTELLSIHAAMALPLASTAICGSEALTVPPEITTGDVVQFTWLLYANCIDVTDIKSRDSNFFIQSLVKSEFMGSM